MIYLLMKIHHSMTFFLCLLHFLLSSQACAPESNSKPTIEPPQTTSIPDTLTTLTVSAIGDLMCHSTQYNYAYKADGTYDFVPVYDAVRDYISAADIATANLETVLAGKTTNYGGYPGFNTPNAYADGVKSAGFDVIITSNNHSLDQGEAGIIRTLNELKKRDLTSIGTFENSTDRDSIRLFDKNGIKLAIMAYTEFSNRGYPNGKKYLLNFMDSLTLKKDIENARKKGAEIVMINFHWGKEYQQEPSDYQKNMANYAVQCGADVIVGHHPHCLQPFQLISKKSTKIGLDTAFVAYSLGNFYSNQRWRFSDAGAILTFHFTKNKNTDKIYLQTEYVPTWLFKGQAGNRRRYIVLPAPAIEVSKLTDNLKDIIPYEMKFLTSKDRDLMAEAYADCQRILGNYGVKTKIGLWKNRKNKIQYLPQLDSISLLKNTLKIDNQIKK